MHSVLNGREKRILLLAFIFFLCGVLFFFLHFERTARYPEAVYFPPAPKETPRGASGRGQSPFLSYPDAANFEHFVFSKDVPAKDLFIDCKDDFAAVLVFESGVDYRSRLLDAKYNVAHACKKGEMTAITIDLSGRPFVHGKEYYVIRAQQGMEGEWYNPY